MTLFTEVLEWHRDPADLPDADTTVVIELDPDFDYSEPVYLGWHAGDAWHDVMGDAVHVIAWANVPKGTRG